MGRDQHLHVMFKRSNLWLVALVALAPLAGCRLCGDCEDLNYPAYGGAWQRTLRQSGRVGSVFDPGGARQSVLAEREALETPDETQRKRETERRKARGLSPVPDEGSSSRGTEPLPSPSDEDAADQDSPESEPALAPPPSDLDASNRPTSTERDTNPIKQASHSRLIRVVPR